MVFDRFHVERLAVDAVDEVRRAEQRRPDLKDAKALLSAAGRRGILRDAALTTTLGVAIVRVPRSLVQATGAGFLPAHGPARVESSRTR